MSKAYPIFLDKEEARKIFALSKDVGETCKALVAVALNEPDWKWAQEICLFFLFDKNPDISGVAATCLGHLARLHGHKINKRKVIIALKYRSKNSDIRGKIEDALSDIDIFIRRIKKPRFLANRNSW